MSTSISTIKKRIRITDDARYLTAGQVRERFGVSEWSGSLAAKEFGCSAAHLTDPSRGSGNDPLRAEPAHEPYEHFLAVDHVVEAEPTQFSEVRHHVPFTAEYVIGKRPSHELIVGVALQL